ncbi:MAG: GDP-L-fucose synthase [Rhodospirillaceae bacterium]|nr:GDP-L-fucose synthase [Rhodospirillaceae bacterium]
MTDRDTIRALDPPFRLAGRRVFVAGHRGMVGAACVRRLASEDCEILIATREDADLRRQDETEEWVRMAKPDVVIVAAATVGGILANSTRPAEFLYDNLVIESNLIEAAHKAGVAKLLFLGSSCIYPKLAEQPMREDALLTGPLEPTNEWYAIAKIAGIKLCQAYRRQHGSDFISAMPANLYGPGDNFDLQSSHVVPALIRKIDAAKQAGQATAEIWGSGKPKREFLHVDDLADALVYLLKFYSGESHVNVGTGSDVTIAELAETIATVVGWKGRFVYDASKPDGTPRKLLDVSLLASLGWRAQTGLEAGLRDAYRWYQLNRENAA